MSSSGAEKANCDICKYSSNTTSDCILFGDWMHKQNVKVHYFCLLLSTHLRQNGKDCSGILGFLMRDIRKEILAATERQCVFCHKRHASIRCRGCKDYFHLYCGTVNGCMSQFGGRFDTYCAECLPLKAMQRQWKKQPPSRNELCHICRQLMDFYSPAKWIYAPCCGNGFAHRVCMLQYALSAGYYLKCIWCRSGEFRELVRLQGIFVPDRDAQWERQKDAYAELHRGHRHCDAERCRCPRGRDFVGGKWELLNCALCGSVGVHNPQCMPGREKSKQKLDVYKCEICSTAEQQRTSHHLVAAAAAEQYREENFETTLYQCKQSDAESQTLVGQTPTFSDEDSVSSKESSVVTVVLQHSVVGAPPAAAVAPTVSLLPPPSPLERLNEAATPEAVLPSTAAVDALEESFAVIDLCTQTEEGGICTPTITTSPESTAGEDDNVADITNCELTDASGGERLESTEAAVEEEDEDPEASRTTATSPASIAVHNNADDECVSAKKTTWIDEAYVADNPAMEFADMVEWLCTCTDFCPVAAAAAKEPTTSSNAVADSEDDEEDVDADYNCELNDAAMNDWLETSNSEDDDIAAEDDEDQADDEFGTTTESLANHDIGDGEALSPSTADSVHGIEVEMSACPAVEEVQERMVNLADLAAGVEAALQHSEVVIVGNFATFWMFDFVEGGEMRCTGQSKIRIDLSSARFAGKTIEAILESGQISDDDVIERSDDIGIFAAIDRIIERSI